MAVGSIQVELANPGQVFACLGFMEAAEVLVGAAEARFEWSATSASFALAAAGSENPFALVLRFLAEAKIVECVPIGYVEAAVDENDDEGDAAAAGSEFTALERRTTSTFPSREGGRYTLPVRLESADGQALEVGHWADDSSRNAFKLYSGNRSAFQIATGMLRGTRKKTLGVTQLWKQSPEALTVKPFDVLAPMGGSFNFDPRGAWRAIDAGYSPNAQKDGVAASPVVEILAAIGLEHARPALSASRTVRYAVWAEALMPAFARIAIADIDLKIPRRRFRCELADSGKNKVMTFATEESDRDASYD